MMIKRVFLSIALCTLAVTALATSVKDQLLKLESEIKELAQEEDYDFISTDKYNSLAPSRADKFFSAYGKYGLPKSILDENNQRTWHPKDIRWKSFMDVTYIIKISPYDKSVYDYAIENNQIDCIASPSLHSTKITYYKNGKEVTPIKKLSHYHAEDKELDKLVCSILKLEYLKNEYFKLLLISKQAMEDDYRMNPSGFNSLP